MIQCPFEKNEYLRNSKTNLKLIELQQLNDVDFRDWAIEFRKETIYSWDELGIPIIDGHSIDKIIEDFQNLLHYDVSKLERIDELTGKNDCIMNISGVGSSCNQFFPTMLKTEDISATKLRGKSIYGYFANDELLDNFIKLIRNVVRQDPFAYFSNVQTLSEKDLRLAIAKEEDNGDLWAVAKDPHKSRGTIFTEKQIEQLVIDKFIDKEQIIGQGSTFEVRHGNLQRRIMDISRVFRICFDIRPGTNFPPVVGKYLYTHFTKDLHKQKEIIVYDSSAGWGGRILSAMSTCLERPIHYVGTDPNTDHWMPNENMTKYEYLAEYFNGNISSKRKNTYEIFQLGSEVIHDDEEFQAYFGDVDFIFTSPPYFAAEGYSLDETQSNIKFPTYEEWRDGFLERTLQTCFDLLKPNRWMCWNIADVALGEHILPLQQATIEICTRLGFEFKGYKKMVLATSPGGSKETDDGIPTMRNFCKINGKIRKFEQIFMFWKPEDNKCD